MLEAAVAAGLASAGVDVLLLGVLPTPAVAFLTAESERRPRRGDLRVAQRDAGQRHQVLRGRRPQALRRDRGRHRGGHGLDGRTPDRRTCRPDQAGTRRRSPLPRPPVARHPAPAGRVAGGRRLRERRGVRGGTGGLPPGRRRGDRDRRRSRRTQHQRRGRLDAPRCAARRRGRARRRPRHRSRRGRGSVPGGRRRRHRGGRRCDPGVAGAVAAAARRTGLRHRRHHGDGQSRPAQGDGRRRDHGADHCRRRPVRARGDGSRRLLAGRRAVRAHHPVRDGHDRRRTADRAAPDVDHRVVRPVVDRVGRSGAAVAAGAVERPGGGQGHRLLVPGGARARWPPRRPSSTAPAGCCCGPPAPSRWSG